jgi:hypothetical protein
MAVVVVVQRAGHMPVVAGAHGILARIVQLPTLSDIVGAPEARLLPFRPHP